MAVRGRVTRQIYQTRPGAHTSGQPSAPWTEAFRAGQSVKELKYDAVCTSGNARVKLGLSLCKYELKYRRRNKPDIPMQL